MTYPKKGVRKVGRVAADNKTETSVGCRMEIDRVLFVDRAVQKVRAELGRLDYSRADFISETVLERAEQVLGETAPVAA